MDHHEKWRSYVGTELLAVVQVSVLPLPEEGMAVHMLLNLSFACQLPEHICAKMVTLWCEPTLTEPRAQWLPWAICQGGCQPLYILHAPW